MSYDNPISVTYNFAAVDFGAGDKTRKIKPPQGKVSGRVADIHLAATEVFNQVTTQAYARIGDGTDDDKYAELPIGALAANASLAAAKSNLYGSFNLDVDGVTELELNMIAPTGGTPSGIADVAVTVEWF